MTIAKREIYSIGYNRSFTDGVVRLHGYTLGVVSLNGMKMPEKIEEIGDFVVVTFMDQTRHKIPLSGGVEIMDRIIELKNKETK